MNKRILSLAIPNIISNITIPLLGMVDLVIVGNLGDDDALAGMAIGTAIFSLLYWNFSFLRMGTSGFTAQAYGRRDMGETVRTLCRAMSMSLLIGVMMWMFMIPIESVSLAMMDGSERVELLAASYFYVRIWAAPATMSLYVINGWFIGMQNARTPMWIAIGMNVVNVVTSLAFAVWMEMGVEGVALGTVVAQWSGMAMGLGVIGRRYGRIFRPGFWCGVFDMNALVGFFKVNINIFIRTVCIVAVFTYFTVASSVMGDTYVAANTLMLQFCTLFSYLMDGFAYSGEALVGRYYGASNSDMVRRAVRGVFIWGGAVAMIVSVVYALWSEDILRIFTDSPAILALAGEYIWWTVAIPVVSFAAFLMDGILVGITASAIMRNVMMISTALFFGVFFVLKASWQNDALWAAFIVYLGARGLLQILAVRTKSLFKNSTT